MTSEAVDPAARRRSRASLLLIFTLFAAPVMIASLLFFVFPDWVPQATTNHGTLVKPVRPLPAFSVQTLDGETLDETWLRGKWTFVYMRGGECDEACVQRLYEIRQVRLSQGKNFDRLQRLMLWSAADVAPERRQELQAHFPGQRIVAADTAALQPFSEVFAIDGEQAFETGRIYLVDPLGNLMMSYTLDDPPQGIIKDLHRLLKYSGLG